MTTGVVVADPLYKLHAGDSNAEREAVGPDAPRDAWREQLRFAFLRPSCSTVRKPVPGAEVFDSTTSSGFERLRAWR